MERQHRHELKHDEFKDTLVQLEEYFKKHYKEVLNVAIIVVVVVGLAGGLKYYTDRQEAAANTDLGEALATFRAYVGQPTPGQSEPGVATYTTAQEKYKKALQQFDAILDKYKMLPRPKAVAIARYQAGVCQSLLDDHTGAVQTLTEASQDRDPEIASMAKFALGGELAKSGKTPEAAKLYQDLADHPTLAVPKASALLALADAYRESQPAQARKIYEQVEKEFASNATVAQAVKQQMASLTP
ncbi:MAG TPA: tetratricopeptide repeat protein [Terriglobia bacterium]|nr:tetratricopeptide repeat protein [Terriglobia bacterium]